MRNEFHNFIERKHQRFEVMHQHELSVQIAFPDANKSPIEAKLLDISRGGAKIASLSAIEGAILFSIDMPDAEPALQLESGGVVQWSRTRNGMTWFSGVAFNQEVGEEAFERILRQREINGRQFTRYPVTLTATAFWNAPSTNGPTDGVPVMIHDLSRGGLCFSTQERRSIGESFPLLVSDEDRRFEAGVIIRWRLDFTSGFVYGCEFADPEAWTAFLRRGE